MKRSFEYSDQRYCGRSLVGEGASGESGIESRRDRAILIASKPVRCCLSRLRELFRIPPPIPYRLFILPLPLREGLGEGFSLGPPRPGSSQSGTNGELYLPPHARGRAQPLPLAPSRKGRGRIKGIDRVKRLSSEQASLAGEAAREDARHPMSRVQNGLTRPQFIPL